MGSWRPDPTMQAALAKQRTQSSSAGAQAPVSQPYDPTTGLPNPNYSYTPTDPRTGQPATSTIQGHAPGSVGMAPAAQASTATSNPTYETRTGAGHFGGGDATSANVSAGYATDPNASTSTGTTPTQQSPQPYLEDLYKQLGSAYLAPSYTDTSMGGLQSQLAQPGQAEQFYQQAQNTATDPYYQRLRQQGQDALNQQMAARGSYNSGGALAALGNFDSGLAAQQYSQMGQLANQAQQEQLARTGLSGQLANTADQNDLSRLNSLFGVAGQAQGANQSGINNMLSQQMGISNMNSGLVGGFYGNGGQLSGQSATDAINALIQAGQASAQGQQARQGGLQAVLPFLFS